MRHSLRLVPVLILAGFLAGCGPGGSDVRSDDTQRREMETLQRVRDDAVEQARHERGRCAFWQGTAFALMAIVFLVIGVALGSRSKPDGTASRT